MGKNVSAHKLNGGGPIVREGIGGGKMFEVEWLGGLCLPRGEVGLGGDT